MSRYYATANGSYVLYHSGIKGMKWGIRRFQNEDGSLTEAGKKRYNKLAGKIEKQAKKIEKYQRKVDNNSRRYARAARLKVKSAKLKAKSDKLITRANRAPGWRRKDRVYRDLTRGNALAAKSTRLANKAAKLESKTITNEAKIKRAQSLINKYSRKIAKLDPSSKYATSQFINGQYQKKLSSISNTSKNTYDINFLEAVQNKQVLSKGGKDLQKAYSQYLNNPEKFMVEDVNKLKDQS